MKPESPDKSIDALWAEEAESRIDAYDRGEIESVSVDEVMAGVTERHRKILQSRETEAGKFSDWNDAKREIRDRVCCSEVMPKSSGGHE